MNKNKFKDRISDLIKGGNVHLSEEDVINYRRFMYPTSETPKEILKSIEILAEKYGHVSYADYLDLLGEESLYTDHAIGWSRDDIENSTVLIRTNRDRDNEYYINFPNVHKIGPHTRKSAGFRNDFNDYNPNFKVYIIGDEDDAMEIKNRLQELMYMNGAITYADYLGIMGVKPNYGDKLVGWDAYSLENISVKNAGNKGYYIDLPDVEEIGGVSENKKGDDKMKEGQQLTIGDIIKDERGNMYQIHLFCKNEMNNQTMVVFKDVKKNSFKTTSIDMFHGKYDLYTVVIKGDDLAESLPLELALKSLYGTQQ